MQKVDYSKIYAEVLEVLKYISIEEYNKISKNFITYMEENCDENSTFLYNVALPFDRQNLSEDAKNLLAMIFRLFLITDDKKQELNKIDEIARQNRKGEEKKYSYENIFNNKQEDVKEESTANIIEYKKQNWFQKIFSKILRLLKK